MEAYKRLLRLDMADLIVWEIPSCEIAVSYQNCYVKGDGVLIGTFGTGCTFEVACEDYLNKISGKTLVFDSLTTDRKEVKVL